MTGRSGTGKTEFLGRYVARARYPRTFVFDGQGELSPRWGVSACVSVEDLQAALERSDGIILFDPAGLFPEDLCGGFGFFSDWSFSVSECIAGPKLFVADELQQVIGTAGLPPSFCAILETGRRAELDCAIVSQQINLIHNRIRNQLTEFVTFAHVDPRALEWIGDLGLDPEEVRGLPEGDFISLDLRAWQTVRGSLWA